jgi:hypothetical protein
MRPTGSLLVSTASWATAASTGKRPSSSSIDSGSYLPVRIIAANFADQPGPLQHYIVPTSETWLKRSPALVSITNHTQIPAGFTRVPAP